ncbi:MAG: PilC/PilY family type IV pilus protein [Methylotenera sp.]|uniref:pilus assembly protein n=1 Tax=Methylotenera sp. TaxID=2051956 RepID=UPI0027314725|nr:PilC/PilY family type IV pilus protein [Methylotenera sp.]MDP1523406.1 PilC/PilY family type IV pilus protein [Methylotenera sp.]
MKHSLNYHVKSFMLFGFVLLSSIGLPGTSLAAPATAPVALATTPLANSTTTVVKPNLMFILDNSGSMSQDYTPDYMSDIFNAPATDDKQCRDSGDDGTSGSSGTVGAVYSGPVSGTTRVLDLCVVGDPPYMSSDMNSQYYNPKTRYKAAVNYDGTSRGDQINPTSVLTDSFNIQNKTQLLATATTVNLTTSYPDRVWCTTQSPTAANLIDPAVCRKNGDYLYPNATFKYGRTSGLPDQQVTQTMLNGVIKVSGAPYYYSVIPTEYCTASDLKDCILTSVPTAAYTFPAKSRWCNSSALTTCQSIKAGAFIWPRYVGQTATGVAANNGQFRVGNSTPRAITSVKVGTVEILGASVTSTLSRADLASKVAAQINLFNSSPEYTASVCSTDYVCLTSTVAAGASANGTISVAGSAGSSNITNLTNGVTGSSLPPYTFIRTDIISGTFPKDIARTDCAGAVGPSGCSYAEEITNFGNWYTYYRTRMQGMKSAASLTFQQIDSRYRVGFITIANQSSNYLPINSFDAGAGNQKNNWYTKLFGTVPSTSTPLRSALSIVGRIYAGKNPVSGFTSDPVQYSCQQNFALLTTDGYWNGDTGASDILAADGTATIGNRDAGPLTTNPRPFYEGPTASNNSLADVAKYYYDTDLRTSTLGNCTGAGGLDVCENNVFVSSSDNNVQQHMTTFTLGLGIDGTLIYTTDYKDATSGDYYNIKNGLGTPTANWPVPAANTEAAVDDLWHAAVNGRGTYFSAKNPDDIITGLGSALNSITARLGSSAAAATSTLNPVAGDNFAYVASYTTVNWTGNLEARTINTSTGVVSEAASWCVEDVVAGTCSAPGAIVADTSGGSTVYNCVTGTVSVEMPVACSGRMQVPGVVGPATDTRKIWTKGANATSLNNFKLGAGGDLSAADFDTTKLSGLSQWSLLDSTQKAAAVGSTIVNYLRGQTGYDDRAGNNDGTNNNRLFRFRESTMGDAVESQPAYVGKPTFSYTDTGYSAFKATARAGTVYIGANDGMLHAFDAVTGDERWAYVPSMLISKMWKLADKNYSTNHDYYANGSPTISDVYDGSAWRTILVAGLNGGGRGYYALDITNPAAPTLLWEFTPANDPNLGYTFGNPVITKKSNGDWVVLVTSGYNNIPDANYPLANTNSGKGFLYVLDAINGPTASFGKIGTGAGSVAVPSGLAKIATWADDPEKNNTATYTYGGDLLGNVWRFDINAGTAFKFAVLKEGSTAQPITTRPELGKVLTSDGVAHRVVYIGTGKYLETLDLTDLQQQTLYAIKDDNATVTFDDPRNGTGVNLMVQQTLTTTGANRTASNNPVDFKNNRGWFVDFAPNGERQNVASQLVLGTLLVPTTIPSNTVCSPGGTSWLNYFNYKTGGAVDTANNLVSTLMNSPIVGVNVLYIPGADGKIKPVISTVTAGHPTPDIVPGVPFSSSGSGFQKKRVIWHELIQ